ncbi:MAG: hypothetical protein HXX81_04700 [Campylobacterales bacterium]|nr:hypothetical protein [Campylobacterales bacterium]
MDSSEIVKKEVLIEEKFDYLHFFKVALSYLIVFVLGFLAGKFLKFSKKRVVSNVTFIDTLKNIDEPKEFLKVLISNNQNREFDYFINSLEDVIYSKTDEKFQSIKQNILTKTLFEKKRNRFGM